MKTVITGGSGFIGAAVARQLLQRGEQVGLLDRSRPAAMWRGDPIESAQFIAGDVLDASDIATAINEFKPDRLVHSAAIVGAGLSIDSPLKTVTTNCVGITNVLEAARAAKIGRTVFISSQSVYGQGRYEPVDERHPTDPESPYGATKLASEKLGAVYQRCFGVDFVSLRMSHIYGPGRPSGLRGNVIQEMLEAALRRKPFVMKSGGDQTKEPSHIDDISAAVCAALDAPTERLTSRVFNVGSGEVLTWRQIADIVRELYPQAELDIGPGLAEVRPGLGEQMLGPLDVSLAARLLNFSPRYRIRDGLQHFASWLTQHQDH
jgi:nucleoside-diphosphate-sugar epimerase